MASLFAGLVLLSSGLGQASPVKAGPTGVYCLMPFQLELNAADLLGLQSDPIWGLPNIEGVAVRCSWAAIEPREGVFNFQLFDEAVTLAARYNRKLSFSVTAGTFTPGWVYAAGAQTFNFTQNDGNPGKMPLPWDSVFQKKWFGLIQALGHRYDHVPALTYVAMGGIGQQMEGYFAQTPADIQTFDNMGGQQKWLAAAKAIAAEFARRFPTTHLIYAVAPPTVDQAGVQTLTQMVSACAKKSPKQFGIRSDGLRPEYSEGGPVGLMLLQYAHQITTGFQMSLPAKGQPLSLWFAVAGKMQADFVEVYHDDCEDPDQADALEQAGQDF